MVLENMSHFLMVLWSNQGENNLELDLAQSTCFNIGVVIFKCEIMSKFFFRSWNIENFRSSFSCHFPWSSWAINSFSLTWTGVCLSQPFFGLLGVCGALTITKGVELLVNACKSIK
ncbi:Hypothetical_protein [Hexamita inflata]|uniref:Hypothetical_protein n=1 Tax=Hexamita inflata TaxID=28002 RepID=A0AA86UZH1_9EUKA|nr:Hypothetical protein HINF_LOCUS62129 [Hexamita inflata]